MNCDRVRSVLLAAERPEPPPLEIRPHLSGCPDCRAWLRRLASVERQLAWLPVPPSQGKDRLLRRLPEVSSRRTPLSLPAQILPLPARLRERGRRKLSVALALAATVAAFAVGLSFWPHRDPASGVETARGPEAAWERQRVRWLRDAHTPGEHVMALADFAANLQGEAVDLARRADGPRLEALARYYDRLVSHDLVLMAQTVPGEERDAIVGTARTMLGRAESEMERLAAGLAESAGPLRRIARAAREGDRRLGQLLRG